MIHSLQKRKVAQKLETETRDSSTSVSTPTDLQRIRAISPPPPSKLEFSHASTKPEGDHKRSLFDSPASGHSRVQTELMPTAALLDFGEVHSICEQILIEALDIIFPQVSSRPAPVMAQGEVKSLRSLATDKLEELGIQPNISVEDTTIGVKLTSDDVQLEDTTEGVLNQTEEDI